MSWAVIAPVQALPATPSHLLSLWGWFLAGMMMFWLKRAFFLVTGPSPIAHTYGQFIERSWIPLLVRSFLDSLLFSLLFIPEFAASALNYLGWSSFEWAVRGVTQFWPFAAAFGYSVDSVMDMAITKVPFLKDLAPQMPAPLPQPAVVQAAIVEIKTTALETKTTTIPTAEVGK